MRDALPGILEFYYYLNLKGVFNHVQSLNKNQQGMPALKIISGGLLL